jgi:hypothetical protein
MPRRGLAITIVLTAVPFLHAQTTWPTGQLVAHGRLPKRLGHPGEGYIELYEFGMWLNEAGPSSGLVKRCGDRKGSEAVFSKGANRRAQREQSER